MQERLLQVIWKERYYNSSSLATVDGEPLLVQDCGQLNTHQGPDFLHARIVLNGTNWIGNIEIHIKSSDWFHHQHHVDPQFNNVILHVVWEDDAPGLSSRLPTLELRNRVPSIVLKRYAAFGHLKTMPVCRELIPLVPPQVWTSWKTMLLIERLNRKAGQVLERLREAGNNWETCSWWWIARNFGGPVNGEFFEQVARSIPKKILSRHRDQVIQLEALLLGQANLLGAPNVDPYVQLLQREYRFLRHKYQLMPVHGQAQFLRMRPAGFPTLRLAQLAMFLHSCTEIQHHLLKAEDPGELEKLLEITANDYWHYHFTLDDATAYQPKRLGKETVRQIIVNGYAPLLFAAGIRYHQAHLQQKAMKWMGTLPAEANAIQRLWQKEGIKAANAGESQALTELSKYYCAIKNCLDCKICQYLLSR